MTVNYVSPIGDETRAGPVVIFPAVTVDPSIPELAAEGRRLLDEYEEVLDRLKEIAEIVGTANGDALLTLVWAGVDAAAEDIADHVAKATGWGELWGPLFDLGQRLEQLSPDGISAEELRLGSRYVPVSTDALLSTDEGDVKVRTVSPAHPGDDGEEPVYRVLALDDEPALRGWTIRHTDLVAGVARLKEENA